jgi:hypothetical protein
MAIRSQLIKLRSFFGNYAANAVVNEDWSSIFSAVDYPS